MELLELDPANLIVLCENWKDGVCCHLLFGHLGSFKSFNVDVVADAKLWHDKITNRPGVAMKMKLGRQPRTYNPAIKTMKALAQHVPMPAAPVAVNWT